MKTLLIVCLISISSFSLYDVPGKNQDYTPNYIGCPHCDID